MTSNLPPEADPVVVATVTTQDPSFKIDVPSTNPGGIEREVFGKLTVLLRNITGAIAVLTSCVVCVLNAVSVNHSVVAGQGWPDMWIMFIVMVGPVIVGWTWINANKTLATLLEGTSLTTKIRGKMADIVAPKDYQVVRPETPPPGPPSVPGAGYAPDEQGDYDADRRPPQGR